MLKDFYDIETEPVIKLEDFYDKPKNIAEKCLIIFSKEIHDYLLNNHDCCEVGLIYACNGNIPIYCMEYKGESICFYLTGVGSAVASEYSYEAHWQTGADKFIMFGSCGSLDPDKTTGRYIIPTHSYRGDGSSYYYAPAADYIEIKTSSRTAEIFEELKIPCVSGRVWTTDSMLRETRGLVNKRRSEGCIAVEMELAGVQALCDFYGMTLYSFLEAGDVLADSGYEVSGLNEANHSIGKLLIALELALRI